MDSFLYLAENDFGIVGRKMQSFFWFLSHKSVKEIKCWKVMQIFFVGLRWLQNKPMKQQNTIIRLEDIKIKFQIKPVNHVKHTHQQATSNWLKQSNITLILHRRSNKAMDVIWMWRSNELEQSKNTDWCFQTMQ